MTLTSHMYIVSDQRSKHSFDPPDRAGDSGQDEQLPLLGGSLHQDAGQAAAELSHESSTDRNPTKFNTIITHLVFTDTFPGSRHSFLCGSRDTC